MKLLIANRGEIAVRIARGARLAGIETVAVFSDPDRHALHVAECDEAVYIGPADATASYLNAEAILAAAAQTRATAVHPGYGFLAENADFARTVIERGLTWVGPRPEAIEQMGSKINARRLATAAGVPIIPGYDTGQDDELLAAAADEIGYPVMIKASAGGGGKGIRIVTEADDFATKLSEARQESRRAFGDDAVIVERYITRPRHIEVQIVGDHHGNVVHLGTRECSLQRRHQKVIEEAPAPWLSDETRRGLHESAVALARAIGYENAGTVEFVVDDATGDFFFLEMNTRLQVEHPVTEMVTGVDLVGLQIAVAAGQPLPMDQAGIAWHGHAIEARLNAEDPWLDFRPQVGRVAELRIPKTIRWDGGIEWGSEITPHYDSMIAKVIAHGPDRETSRRRLVAALDELHVVGITTNQALLRWMLAHPRVVQGPVTTRFLDEEPLPDRVADESLAEVAAIAWLFHERVSRPTNPWTATGRMRLTPHVRPRIVCLETAGRRHDVSIVSDGRLLSIGDRAFEASLDADTLRVEHGGVVTTYPVAVGGARVSVVADGVTRTFRVVPREERWLAESDRDASAADILTAPFPGLITSVLVAPGDEVHEGQPLVVLEAMKMLHTLTAAGHGIVAAVPAREGSSVESGTALVTFSHD